MSKRLAPWFFNGTLREWRQLKRAEWKAMILAAEKFLPGCAFTPVYEKEFQAIYRALESGEIKMQQKHWKGKP